MLSRRVALASACTLLLSAVLGGVGAAPANASPVTVHRGRTADDAAPSCWAIKQSFPTSASGPYWIQTPRLVDPLLVYCDMTSAGGGWELIGRGRWDWKFSPNGQGNPLSVALVPGGVGAFAPATYSDHLVDGLLDGAPTSQLSDGVRVRRAANAAGTAYRDTVLRFAFPSPFTWWWQVGQPLRSVAFGSVSPVVVGPNPDPNVQSTHDVHLDRVWRALHTAPVAAQHNHTGFAFGAAIYGTPGPSSYLFSVAQHIGYALPFTQVFVRPHLGDADVHYTAIPAHGLPAITNPVYPSSTPQHFDWGVVHVQKPASDPDPMGDSPVYGLVQIGSNMYVGGKFADVEHFATKRTAHQPWLAAFDASTGVWVSTFRPVLDGAVFSVARTPDGHLLVGGNFTNVNGVAGTAGLALLDPTTGAPVAGWQASVSGARFSTPRGYVRNIDVRAPWVYLVGGFNHIDGPNGSAVSTGGVARVALTDGTPDTTWRAFVDQEPENVDASADGTRVYVVGSFSHIGTTSAMSNAIESVAVLDTTTGAEVPGLGAPVFDSVYREQYAVTEAGANVAVGGNQHWLAGYRASDFSFIRGTLINPHGDMQVLAMSHGVLFGGCHCHGLSETDGPTQYTRTDPINWVGAWDPVTFARDPRFIPQFRMAATQEGAWALTTDAAGCLWIGGDIVQGATTRDLLGGFARFCPGDVWAPSTPGRFSAIRGRLRWVASTDNSHQAPTYEVLCNDRVVGITAGTSFPVLRHGHWAVRAVDGAGNRSASTRPVAT